LELADEMELWIKMNNTELWPCLVKINTQTSNYIFLHWWHMPKLTFCTHQGTVCCKDMRHWQYPVKQIGFPSSRFFLWYLWIWFSVFCQMFVCLVVVKRTIRMLSSPFCCKASLLKENDGDLFESSLNHRRTMKHRIIMVGEYT